MGVLIEALSELAEPLRLGMLLLGVVLGLVIGVIPGLGGIFGLTLLIPLTYTLDPISALALLLGMSAVTTTSDTIPAVLLGVPGTVGSAATVLDGHEMAKQGHAAQALGAAYMASLIGGVFGALVLALSLPMMRPLVLLLNYGDLLAITIFGLTLVALLSGESKIRGVLAALLGVLVSLIGLDPYEGAERWTMGSLYFWGGVPTAIVFLGLFGLSELAALSGRGQIQQSANMSDPGGLRRGMYDALRHWRLVLKSSAMGTLLGAVPGIGVTVIEWIAYGNAARHPGPGPAFGKGNIRGVIGPESANNAKEGGALLPTLAFGIPGSAPMAILLGAFAIHGITAGPNMLGDDAPLLVSMVLAVAVANVIGAVICMGLTPQLAKIASIPATLIVPVSLVFIGLGAFSTNKVPHDLMVLLVFGLLGIAFRKSGWSRPAFALGFVLGPSLERYFVLTYQISGWNWLSQPFVLIVFAIIAAGLLRRLRVPKERTTMAIDGSAEADFRDGWLIVSVMVFVATLAVAALPLPNAARILPLIVCCFALSLGFLLMFSLWMNRKKSEPIQENAPTIYEFISGPAAKFIMTVVLLAVLLLGFGHLAGPMIFILIILSTQHAKKRSWSPVFWALGITAVSYLIFDLVAQQSWPTPLAFKILSVINSSLQEVGHQLSLHLNGIGYEV